MTAGHLARSEYFPYTHARELDWEQRRELLIHEMQTLDSDIICCQVRRVRHVWVIERYIFLCFAGTDTLRELLQGVLHALIHCYAYHSTHIILTCAGTAARAWL